MSPVFPRASLNPPWGLRCGGARSNSVSVGCCTKHGAGVPTVSLLTPRRHPLLDTIAKE